MYVYIENKIEMISSKTPYKLLMRLPVLLVQIKSENNSYKLKSEIRRILYLLPYVIPCG